jgi:hypothetical protein
MNMKIFPELSANEERTIRAKNEERGINIVANEEFLNAHYERTLFLHPIKYAEYLAGETT